MDLVARIEVILYAADPIRIAAGVNRDEYRPEAQAIVARLPSARSVDEVELIVHQEFVRLFDRELAGPRERYRGVAATIWRLLD